MIRRKVIRLVKITNTTNGVKEVKLDPIQSIHKYEVQLDKNEIQPKSSNIFRLIVTTDSRKRLDIDDTLVVRCHDKAFNYNLKLSI